MQRGFEWRADLGHLRWLLLGTLGVAASACGGRAADDPVAIDEGVPQPGHPGLPGAPGSPPPSSPPSTAGGEVTPSSPPDIVDPVPQPGPPFVGQPTFTSLQCTGPVASTGGGFERCGNGILHRTSVTDCDITPPRVNDYSGAIDGYERYGGGGTDPPIGPDDPPFCLQQGWCCRTDADCTALPHGYCEPNPQSSVAQCSYGCFSDSECGPGQVCLCGNPVGQCVIATCSSDAECPGDFLCSAFVSLPGCGGTSFACQTADDRCTGEQDCGTDAYCTVKDGGSRACAPPSCVIGRPFLVDGAERLAPSVVRADWYAAASADTGPGAPHGLAGSGTHGSNVLNAVNTANALSPELRAAVCRGWLEQARMEHASVAAFARFSLQLMSLGAPPELLLGAASAMQDEIHHARACFELARRCSDTDVGPGPLPIAGALDGADLTSILLATIAEGCIGETIAALEASEALAHTTDPLARQTLQRIARDEAEHASLAWRFVHWALRSASKDVRRAARAAFRRELERPAPLPFEPTAHDAALLEHGLLPEAARQALRYRVLHEVIAPCAEALWGEGLSSEGRTSEGLSSEGRKPLTLMTGQMVA